MSSTRSASSIAPRWRTSRIAKPTSRWQRRRARPSASIDGLVANAQSLRSVTKLADVQPRRTSIGSSTPGPRGTLWLMQAVLPAMREQRVRAHRHLRLGDGADRCAGLRALLGREGGRAVAHAYGGARVGRVRDHRQLCVSGFRRSPPAGQTDDGSDRAAAFATMYAEHPLGRDGDPELDIAPPVAFLLSDASQIRHRADLDGRRWGCDALVSGAGDAQHADPGVSEAPARRRLAPTSVAGSRRWASDLAADPFPGRPGRSHRGRRAPGGPGVVLARVGPGPRGHDRALLPSLERPLHPVGRAEPGQRLPPRAHRPAAALPRCGGRCTAANASRSRCASGSCHMPEWGTRKALSSAGARPRSRRLRSRSGSGATAAIPGWVEIPEDVTTLSLREFYVDWQPEEPAVFTIECLDPPAVAAGA